jgi:endonuclease/exonuclease/phosphatase family metal-dependent hydrolase
MKSLNAQIVGQANGAEVFLLSQQVEQFEGLTTSFALNPANPDPQYLGLVAAQNPLRLNTDVVLKDGRQIRCVESKNIFDFVPTLGSEKLNLNCDGQNVELKVWQQPASAAQRSFSATRQALTSGAGLVLTDVENPAGQLEITLSGNILTIAENSEKQLPAASVRLSENEISGFLNMRSALIVNCQTAYCSENQGPLSLVLKPDGEITGHRTFANNSSQAVFRLTGSEALRVATYNVENFWDDEPDNSTPYDDFSKDLSDWYSGKFAQRKALRIRDALLAAGLPDVAGLQEIESAANRGRAMEILKPVLAPLGYNYFALGQQSEDNPTAVTTAFISKYPILENTRLDFLFDSPNLSESDRPDFTGASRDPQRITVALPEGIPLMILNSHWKSKRDKSPVGDEMRQRIGTLIREHLADIGRIQGEIPAAIIMGDFNADYREIPVQSGLQLASTLAAARLDSNSLFNLWQTRSADRQGNYPHDAALNALDNMVVTQALLKNGALVLNQALTVTGDFGSASKKLRNGDGLPLRSQRHQIKDENRKLRTFHKDSGYSDHLPLVAEFKRSLSADRSIQPTIFSAPVESQNVTSLSVNSVPDARCSDSETRVLNSSDLASVLLIAERGACLEIRSNLQLRKTGLFNIAFELPAEAHSSAAERLVIVSADRAFGANKNWLRQTLQQSSGKTLTLLRGRVGLIDGVKALFISQPERDIVFAQN